MFMELQIFSNSEFGEIRTITKDDEPMFCLADVCKALELSNPSMIKSRLNEKGISNIDTLTTGGKQKLLYVNESNLYKTIFQSRKESAERFTDWVTSEVLPSIRKNGGYIAGQETMSDDELMAKALLVANNKIAERDKIIEQKQARIEQMKPKEIFADAVSASHTSILVGDLAKLICQNGYKIGQNRLFDWLRDNGYLMKYGTSRNMPQQKYVEQGLFEVKESNLQNPDGSVRITRTPKVTGKGQVYFVNKFLSKESLKTQTLILLMLTPPQSLISRYH
jgi:anti-repressor protein